MQEILVILVLALIFLGPAKLPELASGIGKAIREVRKATADIKNEIQLDEAIRKPLEELREATMLPPEELKRRDEERKWRAQREKEDAEAAARGETATDPVASGADSYDPSHYDEHHDEDDYHHYDEEDPNTHPPVATDGAAGVASPDLTVKDLPPVSPAPAPASIASSPVSAAPAPVAPAPSPTSAPAPLAASREPTSAPKPITSTLLGRAPTNPDDRTIAMPLPPPMEGSAVPSLPPPPRPPMPRTTPAGGIARATPPPPPPGAMKAPTGAVARPTGTMIGMTAPPVPKAVPVPAPAASDEDGSTTAPPGVKLPVPPAKKT